MSDWADSYPLFLWLILVNLIAGPGTIIVGAFLIKWGSAESSGHVLLAIGTAAIVCGMLTLLVALDIWYMLRVRERPDRAKWTGAYGEQMAKDMSHVGAVVVVKDMKEEGC